MLNKSIQNFFQPEDLTPSAQRYHLVAQSLLLGGLLLHGVLLVFFRYFEVWFLYYFNIGSVLLFGVLIWLVHRRRYLLTIPFIPLEIIAHQIAGVVILGWGAGLQYFLLLLAVASFLYLRGLFFLKTLLAALSIGSFAVLALLYGATWSTGALPDHIVMLLNQACIWGSCGLIVLSLWIFSSRLESFEAQLEQAHAETQRLLHNILPPAIAEKLKTSNEKTVERLDSASILFADIVGFTRRAAATPAGDLVNLLNGLFTRFDDGIEKFHLEKIKTIGDAYMVAAGVPQPHEDHALELTAFALWMLRQTDEFNTEHGTDLHIRIGICSGPVIAGVIGHKKFAYDLWGDTVNMAARMEQSGIEDKIQVTESTFQLLHRHYRFARRDDVEIKGKGTMHTYILEADHPSRIADVA